VTLGRRLRRRLGLPALSTRAWLLVVLGLLAGVYAGTALVGEFVVRLLGYTPPVYYEPKDIQRQQMLERKPERSR
jgi:hypothetical protein